jgi:hypothetical protein
VEWEARKFATFNLEGALMVQNIAVIIERVFESVLGCAGRSYGIDVQIIELSED